MEEKTEQEKILESAEGFIEKCKENNDGFILFYLDKKETKVYNIGHNVTQNEALTAVKLLILNHKIMPQQINAIMMEEMGKVQKNRKPPLLTPPKGLTDINGKPLRPNKN